MHAQGHDQPTPIQARALPPALAGQNIIGLAQTGTGKTAAFVLPIVQRLMQAQASDPRALIITPTRELAVQITRVVARLSKHTGLRCMALYGGVPIAGVCPGERG